MIAENLLAQIADHGMALRIAGDKVTCCVVPLVPGDGSRLPDHVLSKVVAGKRHLLALCVCRECGRVTTDMEDFERLRQPNPFCDVGKCPYLNKRGWK